MNKEFKITKGKSQTVYTLESASSGGTSSGSIASVSSPMGGVRKRGGNLIAQEASKDKVPASTPRNFVAKNAKTGGAGAHKDKKKEQKQGNAKHKKPYMEDLKDRLDNLKSKLAEGEFWGNNKMANAANQASSSTATVRNKDEKGTYTSTMHRKKGESDHKEVSRKYDNEKKVSERDDREDDEHGGGPTPWENPDKGWAPKKVKEAAKWRQGYSASGHPAGHKHKSGEVGPVGGTFTNEPSGYDGETSKVPVQKHRDQPDQLASRGDTKVSTSGKPLLPRNAQKNLKHAIQQSKGKHGPVGDLPEGYKVVPGIDKERYQERPGLEGPFHTESGKVVYYDKREGKYYDPDSDFYISHDDWQAMNQGVAEGRFVKGPGGVPLDRQGNAIPPKPQAEPKAPVVRRDANGLTRAEYQMVWRKIEEVVGQIFPDGDPIDWLGPWLDRKRIQNGGEVLNKACRLNGFKDIYDYYDHFKIADYGYEAPVREMKKRGLDEQGVAEGEKVDRQASHITKSMMKKGKSKKDAESIAWAHIKHPKNESVDPYFESLTNKLNELKKKR